MHGGKIVLALKPPRQNASKPLRNATKHKTTAKYTRKGCIGALYGSVLRSIRWYRRHRGFFVSPDATTTISLPSQEKVAWMKTFQKARERLRAPGRRYSFIGPGSFQYRKPMASPLGPPPTVMMNRKMTSPTIVDVRKSKTEVFAGHLLDNGILQGTSDVVGGGAQKSADIMSHLKPIELGKKYPKAVKELEMLQKTTHKTSKLKSAKCFDMQKGMSELPPDAVIFSVAIPPEFYSDQEPLGVPFASMEKSLGKIRYDAGPHPRQANLKAMIKRNLASDKFTTESFAIRDYVYDHNSRLFLTDESMDLFWYLTNFSPAGDYITVDLFDNLRPLVDAVADPQAGGEWSDRLCCILDKLIPDMMYYIKPLNHLKANVSFLAGSDGCGKTRLLRCILSFSFMGVKNASCPTLYVVTEEFDVLKIARNLNAWFAGFRLQHPEHPICILYIGPYHVKLSSQDVAEDVPVQVGRRIVGTKEFWDKPLSLIANFVRQYRYWTMQKRKGNTKNQSHPESDIEYVFTLSQLGVTHLIAHQKQHKDVLR
ncbi:hypothetical protein CORC01_09532 [Colletotrichum orchidophilum]|uniref:Uncharacterized protein n=1 Tax=Colletotrichum orchidophilum TaxID=1209926 RepID=A0A1G4B1E7_9PEZI|nr:uncharacterized protein CORC01_09532 [Colletotrichum orchidophilum]OHE95145.1 hypothetical protein CORC01_09532 [Colletotrichum orchidophilum]